MSDLPQAVDLQGEPVQHLHFLDSFPVGWRGLNLIYEREPRGEVPETQLEQHMLAICLSNFGANYWLNGRWRHEDYTHGDVIIFPAHKPFPRVQIEQEVELIELFLEPQILHAATGEDINRALAPQWKLKDPLIEQIGLALRAELAAGGVDSRLYAESMATALSVHLRQRYSQQPVKNYSGGLPRYRLKEVLSYIWEHLEQDLSLAELAAVAHLSPHYFVSLFKQSMELTPHKYITRCRIEKAKELLRQPELPIVEIAQQVGFQNQSHFTRVFRQHTQTTPKVYRDQCY